MKIHQSVLIMKKLFSTIFIFFPLALFSQNNCNTINFAFKEGEKLLYNIDYTWGIIRMNAGEAASSIVVKKINGNSVYHFSTLGKSYPHYDWFFKVHDKYESYADTLSLKPFRFVREVHEDKYYAYDDYVFNHRNTRVYTTETRKDKGPNYDTLNITNCVKDVVTSVFYIRCLDFTNYKINDTIPLTFVLDGSVVPSYIRYLGKEIITTPLLGKIRCIKLQPKLIEGTIFKAGDEMTIWLTDDKNRLPVYLESPIIIGEVRIKLIKYSGLRNKIDCFVPK
ncbi:MAG: hypothetical protein A3F72_10560 [Bacteroidetes bacterium RIFCSPLOWO2_12_FULL_35_15]|nr:MAG: hypothetical protein A3F72_10560 [Bacteroidetes bacterium RIFCSPLOWO2_12_FULL_35_15]